MFMLFALCILRVFTLGIMMTGVNLYVSGTCALILTTLMAHILQLLVSSKLQYSALYLSSKFFIVKENLKST